MFKGAFVLDLLGTIPYRYMTDSRQVQLLRLFRLYRVTEVLDVSRFKKLIKSFFDNATFKEKIKVQFILIYMFKIFRLFSFALMLTYFGGCLWYLIVK